MQGIVLVVLGAAALSLWGVGPTSLLRQNALDFLHIKALGAPATLLLMVAQVPHLPCCFPDTALVRDEAFKGNILGKANSLKIAVAAV